MLIQVRNDFHKTAVNVRLVTDGTRCAGTARISRATRRQLCPAGKDCKCGVVRGPQNFDWYWIAADRIQVND